MFGNRIICIHGINRDFTRTRFIDYIKQMHKLSYKFVSLKELLDENSVEKRILSLTVDDAYKNCVTDLLPILNEYNIKATLFVPTGLIGLKANDEKLLKNSCYSDEDMMDESDIRAWIKAGHVLGFHTHNHIALSDMSWDNIYSDISTGMESLSKFDMKIDYFAYPRGFLPKERELFEQLLINNGILYAFTIAWGDVNKSTPLYINRVCLGDREPLWWSCFKTFGFLDWYYRLHTRNRKEIRKQL